MPDTIDQNTFIPSEFGDEMIDFAIDYSFRARFISGLFLPLFFIVLDYFLVLGLPIWVLVAVGIFEAFINQPHKFLLQKIKNKSDVLLTNIILDIFAIGLVVFYSGGITVPFIGFVFLIVIVFNGILAGITWALMFSLLSSLFVFILAILEINADVIPHTELRMEASDLQIWLISIGYTIFFVLFAILVHLPSKKFKDEIFHRYEAHKTIAESERKYRELFEESKDTVYMSDPEGRFIDINPAGLELFGFKDKQEALNSNIQTETYADPAVRDRWMQLMEEKGYVKDFEAVFRRQDGEERIALETATAVRDIDGKIVVYRGIIRDITEQKRLEEHLLQSHKLESLGYLAGGIAHDFNNILTIIQGSLSVLKTKLQDSPLQSYIELGESGVERGTDIARQLLKFARVEDIRLHPLSVDEVVQELIKVLKHTFEKTVEINYTIAANLSQIQGDRGQLYQMLLNLSINARDAILERKDTRGKGTIDITVDEINAQSIRAHVSNAEQRNHVRITISDTGTGIDSEIHQRVFDPFFTTKPVGKGTGLGLSVVYGVVKSHNGHINFVSEKNKGTTFEIYFPVIKKDEGEMAEEPKIVDVTGTETIFVVEDEDVLRNILTKELQDRGYTVITAGDGNEAVERYKSNHTHIECIVLDIGLPSVSGNEVFQKIKNINNAVPVIIVSGYLSAGQRDELMYMGAQTIIQKPYKVPELVQIIRQQLDKE